MSVEINQTLVDCPDSSLSFDRVIGLLNDALRLFAEEEPDQACQCLAEANRALDSRLADEEQRLGVTPISAGVSAPAAELEEAALATIA